MAFTVAGVGCGGDGVDSGNSQGPVHVHGLGINPKDGSLFIATHTGLFRAAKGERRSKRVGDQHQDTMGFTVAGKDRFLGSGHPAPGEQRPPNLGLIESDDAGKSWKDVSLSGEVDFHVLRFANNRVYGLDFPGGRLMISRDRGKTWSERTPPEPLIDLAVDPRGGQRLIASGEGGLFVSQNEGRKWRRGDSEIGLLAWPSPQHLYRLNAAGQAEVSRDEGRSWKGLGSIGGQPAAFVAQTDRELYAALPDGTIKRSTDGGAFWTVRPTP